MRVSLSIAVNAFMELVRQPVFLLLMTVSSCFCIFLAAIPYFGLGGEFRQVKDSVLAVMFLSGLFGAVLSASTSVTHEIRSGTALAILSKPVGRAQFIFGKFAGIAGALAVLAYVNTLSVLIAARMAYDSYGKADMRALGIWSGAVILSYLASGFGNYYLRRNFTGDAVFAMLLLTTVASVWIFSEGPVTDRGLAVHDLDTRIIPATILIFMALLVLAAIAVACSTRLDIVPTLAICTVVFLLGLVSDYLFGLRAEQGSWWASVVFAALPNWQLFWMSDALEPGKHIPLAYVGKAAVYVAAWVAAALSLALILFEDRDLG
jgi:ABC-type transport system involved in multi-copper enzyme maturation permease subunit